MDRLKRLAPVGLALLLAAVACGGGGSGKSAGRVVDRVRVLRVVLPATGSLGRCLRSTTFRAGRVLVVERIGRVTRSLTIAQSGRPEIFACDRTGVPLEGGEWCGFSAGRLRGGRVTDARLGVLCVDRRGRHVAAAFVNPLRGARSIGVDEGSSLELYPTAAASGSHREHAWRRLRTSARDVPDHATRRRRPCPGPRAPRRPGCRLELRSRAGARLPAPCGS